MNTSELISQYLKTNNISEDIIPIWINIHDAIQKIKRVLTEHNVPISTLKDWCNYTIQQYEFINTFNNIDKIVNEEDANSSEFDDLGLTILSKKDIDMLLELLEDINTNRIDADDINSMYESIADQNYDDHLDITITSNLETDTYGRVNPRTNNTYQSSIYYV